MSFKLSVLVPEASKPRNMIYEPPCCPIPVVWGQHMGEREREREGEKERKREREKKRESTGYQRGYGSYLGQSYAAEYKGKK